MNNLRRIRKNNNLSQLQVAIAIKKNERSIANIEMGKQKLSLEDAINLAELYHITVDEIYKAFKEDIKVNEGMSPK